MAFKGWGLVPVLRLINLIKVRLKNMSSSSYSTPFGAGLAKLAGAFTPSAQRQLLSARAEGIQSRNLANALIAQQKQFDLDNSREAIQSLRNQAEANPDNMDMQNSLLGMLSGKPSAYASSLSAYGKEGRTLNQEKQYQDSLNNLGDKAIAIEGPNGPMNISMADLFKLKQNISQIGSASVTPSTIAKNEAQMNKANITVNAHEAFQNSFPKNVGVDIGGGLVVAPGAFENPNDYATTNKIVQQGQNEVTRGTNLGLTGQSIKQDIKKKVEENRFDAQNNPVLTATNVSKLDNSLIIGDIKRLEYEILDNTQGDVEGLAKAKYQLKSLEAQMKKIDAELPFDKTTLKFQKNGKFTATNKFGQQIQVSVASGKDNKVVPNDLQKVELTGPNGEVTEVMFVSPTNAVRTMNELRAMDKEPQKVYTPKQLGAVEFGVTHKFNKVLKGVPRTQLMNKYNKGEQVVARIKENMDILQHNPDVAGVVGKFKKFSEFTKQFNNVAMVKNGDNYVMWNKSTKKIVNDPATRFALNVVFLKAGARKALIQEARVSEGEQKIVNEIVDGQQLWTDPVTAMTALTELGRIMEDFREVASVGLGIKDFKKHTFGQVVTDLGIPTPSPQAQAPVPQNTANNAVNPAFADTSDDDLLRGF
jgi:hypothetical protein